MRRIIAVMDASNPPPPPGSQSGHYRYTDHSAALVWFEDPWWKRVPWLGAGMLENTPLPLKMSVTEAPDLPAETNTVFRSFWLMVISQLASNWEDIANTIRALISSVREWF